MLLCLLVAIIVLVWPAAAAFTTTLNATIPFPPPSSGTWELGPNATAWQINNPDSWDTTITALGPNSWFSVQADLMNAYINITAASAPAFVSCMVASRLGGGAGTWVNVTIHRENTTINVPLGPDFPTPGFFTYTCSVDPGVTVLTMAIFTAVQAEVADMSKLYVLTALFASGGGHVQGVNSPADEAKLPLSSLSPGAFLRLGGYWEPVIKYQPASVVRPFSDANYTALRGNGTFWFLAPKQTCLLRLDGTVGLDAGDFVVTITPAPPNSPDQVHIRTQMNVTDQWNILFFTILDPKVAYNISVQPFIPGQTIELHSAMMSSSLADVSNWPPGSSLGTPAVGAWTTVQPTGSSTSSADSAVSTDITSTHKSSLNEAALGGGVGGATAVGLLALIGFWRYHVKRLKGNRPTSFAIDDPAHHDVDDDAPEVTPFDLTTRPFPRGPGTMSPGSLDMNASHLQPPGRDREKFSSRATHPSGLQLVGPIAGEVGGGLPNTFEPASPVVHELDAGEFPKVLPPMYRHEWSNASTTNTLASDHSTAGSMARSNSIVSPTVTDLASPVTSELPTPAYTSPRGTGVPTLSTSSTEALETLKDDEVDEKTHKSVTDGDGD